MDFCHIIQPDQKADLIDGVIYMASPKVSKPPAYTAGSSCCSPNLRSSPTWAKSSAHGRRSGWGANDSPEPDIAFVKKRRLHLAREGHIAGPPDVAMEIVSPESVDRDYHKKRALYERAGVAEYWIIDEDIRKVTLLRLGRNGKYREIRPVKGILRNQVIKGFWLRPEWLWAETRPRQADVLKQLLG